MHKCRSKIAQTRQVVGLVIILWPNFVLVGVVHVSNAKLLLGVLAASTPDILTLTIQTAAFPLTIDPLVQNSVCASDTEHTFRALYVTYKCIWLAVAIGVAYLVRNVPHKYVCFVLRGILHLLY